MLFDTKFTNDIENSVKNLSEKLKKINYKVTAIESCTGGMIAAALTALPGSSRYFETGFVTYANEAKSKLVGVKNETLAKFGAVSEETAREMVHGGLKAAKSDCAIAVTGIAGPDGGNAEKPVGLVYIATAIGSQNLKIEKHIFNGDRSSIRTQTVLAALDQLYDQL